jgi:hypothetical protein
MLGVSRRVTTSLVGWLWADLLLGMFAIFLAVSGSIAAASATESVDVHPIELTVTADVNALLGDDASVREREQQRLAEEVERQLGSPGRRVALVFAFGAHENATDGDRLAHSATAALVNGRFAGAGLRAYHELSSPERAGHVGLEIYLYR